MRIIHYLKWMNLREGGTVRAVLDLCAGLASRGHQTILFTADDCSVPESWRKNDPHAPAGNLPACVRVKVRDRLAELRGKTAEQVRHDTPTQLLDTDSMRVIRNAIATADAVHLHGPWATSNHQVAAACRKARIPYILSPHGMLDDWSMAQSAARKRLHLALFSRRTLEAARAVHCTAQGELDQARKHFPHGHGVVIPLLFDTAAFQSLPGSAPALARFPALHTNDHKLLLLSRLHPKKGVEHLLHAAAELLSQGTPLSVYLAGPADEAGYDQRLADLARSLGLEGRCHLLGMVTGVEKVSLLESCDLFVLPTSQENFGFAALEAMACGLPVITTRGVDIWPELLASGGAAIIDSNPRGGELTSVIGRLLKDPPRRAAMGAAGRSWAMSFLDPQNTLAAFEAMYRAEDSPSSPAAPSV